MFIFLAALAVHPNASSFDGSTCSVAQSSQIKARSISVSLQVQSGETANEVGDKESPLDKTETMTCFEGGTLPSVQPPERSDKDVKDKGERGTSHVVAVAVCVVGAIMASMLQFAFVYGE